MLELLGRFELPTSSLPKAKKQLFQAITHQNTKGLAYNPTFCNGIFCFESIICDLIIG